MSRRVEGRGEGARARAWNLRLHRVVLRELTEEGSIHPGRAAAAPRSGLLYVAAGALLFGTNVAVARDLSQLGYDPTAIASLRVIFNEALFLLWGLARGIPWRWPSLRQHLLFLLVGFVGVAFLVRTTYVATALTSVGTAEALLYTSPAWALLLGVPLLGERVGLRSGLSIPLSFCGVLLIVTGGHLGRLQWSLAGTMAGLASGLSLGLYSVLSRAFMVRQGFSEIVTLVWSFGYGALLAILLSPRALALPLEFTGQAWALFAAMAMMAGVGYLLLIHGLARIEAAAATVVGSLEPVFAILAAFLWLGEGIGWVQAAGTAAVLGAAWLAGG